MHTTRRMPSFSGVGAGQTATLNMPIGMTYHAMIFTLGGTTFSVANITEMRLIGNGRPIMTVSGPDLDKMNKFVKLSGASTLFTWYFDRQGLKTRPAMEITAIGTGMPQNLDTSSAEYNPTPLVTLTLEVDIDGAAVAPTLSAKAVQSDKSPLGFIIKRRKFNKTASGAGVFEIADLPKGDVIDKIWIKHGGSLKSVILDRNGYRAFDRTLSENNLIQTNGNMRAPQSNLFVIDPTEMGYGSESIYSAVDDFRLYLDSTAAENYEIYVDYIGGLAGN